MNKYFLNELDSLKGIAQEFSKANPTLAPQLFQASTDPDVERILEGVAFLTAGIRQKIDDDFPEFSQGILNQIFPHYLRPLPSATIIEFKPTQLMRGSKTMRSGTYLDSVEIDDVRCRYKTTCSVDVAPVSITDVKQTKTSIGKRAIDLTLKCSGMSLAEWNTDKIRLHIGGDYQGAVDVFYILNNFVDAVTIINNEGLEHQGDGISVVPIGFDEDFQLLDYPANSFPAYRLIQEYFLLKEKFLFIDIKGVDSVLKKAGGNTCTLRFYIADLSMQIPKLSISRFVLHATPAVNLFKRDAEPFLNDYKRSEYLLQPLRNTNNQYQVYEVKAVTGNNRKKGEKNNYTQMGLHDPEANRSPVYQTYTRVDSPGSNATYISFSYPSSYEMGDKEYVQVELICTNGDHTAKLKPGDIKVKTSNASELVDFENIIAPSVTQAAPTGHSVLWRLLSHLAINYLSLADADNLKSLLELYIFSGHSGNEQDVANRKRIDGIEAVDVQACDRLVKGMAIRGQAVKVTVNATSFTSRGDMYLFGMLLDRLIGSFASLNCFTEFSLFDSTTDETYYWPLRTGDRPLI